MEAILRRGEVGCDGRVDAALGPCRSMGSGGMHDHIVLTFRVSRAPLSGRAFFLVEVPRGHGPQAKRVGSSGAGFREVSPGEGGCVGRVDAALEPCRSMRGRGVRVFETSLVVAVPVRRERCALPLNRIDMTCASPISWRI